MRPGRLRREPGAAGDCSDPGAGGAETPGRSAREAGEGMGMGMGKRVGKGGQGQPSVGARAGTYREQSPRGGRGHSPAMESVAGRVLPNPALSQTSLEKLYSHPTRRA